MHLEPGRVLCWNLHVGGQLSLRAPGRVVEHTPAGLLLWLAAGTPLWRVALPPGAHLRDLRPEDRPGEGYRYVRDSWRETDALILQPAGAAHAVSWMFTGERRFRGWYVNLERRTRQGDDIDVTDLDLDLVVAADRSWQWKDEKSFEDKIGHPAYWTAAEAAAIRAEGRRVAALAESGRFPFDGSWCDFEPPASWTLPALPRCPAPEAGRPG